MSPQDNPRSSEEPKKRALPADLWVFLVGFAILLPFYWAPLFATHFLPGAELPFHLSLADVLYQADAKSAYHNIYYGDLRLAPHLLYYFLIVELGQVLPLGLAHKVLMALYIAALPLGAARLLASCDRSRLPALLGFPLAYNLNLFYGFVHFALALPLLLFFLAQIADNTSEDHDDEEGVHRALGRDAALVGLAVLLCLCHLELYVFGLCAAAIFIALSQAPMVYRIRTSLCLLPSLVTLGWWRATEFALHNQNEDSPGTSLTALAGMAWKERVAELGGHAGLAELLADALKRLQAFPEQVMFGFTDGLHGLGALGVGAVLGLYFVAGTLAVFVRGGDRTLARMGAAGVITLLAALGCFLTLPSRLPQLQELAANQRFAAVAALLGGLLVPSWLKRYPRWALIIWMVPAVVMSGWYGVELTRHFHRYGEEVADFATVLDKTPAGGKAVGLVYDRRSRVVAPGAALGGLPSYYSVERGGAGTVMAQPCCDQPFLPCRSKDPSVLPPAPAPDRPEKLNLAQAVPFFDYYFTRGTPGQDRLFGKYAGQVEQLAKAGTWVVYRKKALGPGPVSPPKAEPAEDPAPGSRPTAKDEPARDSSKAKAQKDRNDQKKKKKGRGKKES